MSAFPARRRDVASQFDRHPTNRIVSLKPARLSVARASNARRLEDRMPLGLD
jgi:hypothetical protein